MLSFRIHAAFLGRHHENNWTTSQFACHDQQKIFLSDNFLILKYPFNELEKFLSSSEKIFFQVWVWVYIPENKAA